MQLGESKQVVLIEEELIVEDILLGRDLHIDLQMRLYLELGHSQLQAGNALHLHAQSAGPD